MADYKSIFTYHLQTEGIKFRDEDEFVISIGFNTANIRAFRIYVYFDEDGEDTIHIGSDSIENFGDGRGESGVILCNSLNNQYRWIKFELDEDMDIVAEIDAIVTPETVGNIGLRLVKQMMRLIDRAYPEIEKAKWA